jgi:RNA polymerase sigma-70 factor (ECF subfamily)
MLPAEWKYIASSGLEQFGTTRWNVVLLEGAEASPRAAAALEQLCWIYWFPLYAYLRRMAYSPQNAHDLTQGFITRLLGKHLGATSNGRTGKFRLFTLSSLNHFLAYERDQAHDVERVGVQDPVPMEARDAECRYLQEALFDLSPERTFERQWAIAVLQRALARLGVEYERAGNTRYLALLRKFLTSDGGDKAYAGVAEELNASEGSIAATVLRMRQRYRELARAEIADTVAGTGDIDDETRWLVAALS